MPQPLEKRQGEHKQPKQPLEKWQKKTSQPLEKKAEASNKKEGETDEKKAGGKQEVATEKQKGEVMGDDKKETKAALEKILEEESAQPLEKRQEESAQSSAAQSSTAQSSNAAKKEEASASEAEPDPEHSWEEKKSKRKKQQEKKAAAEQQKQQPTYLEMVVKGGPLEKGQSQPKKKGKLDDKHYVSLESSSSNGGLPQQPPTPPQPPRLNKGTPAQGERLQLPERQPRPPPKPLKKRLALDWHNCFQIRENGEDVVPNRHVRAFWDLQQDGWEIVLLSYAGRQRGEEVVQWARSLPLKWKGMKIVTSRTGNWGKAAWALEFNCTHVLDDNPEI